MKSAALCSALALIAAPAFVLLIPATARAVECTSDADCSKGMVCKITGGSACAGVACPAGQTCPQPPPCDPQVIKECVPGPCASDSDCGQGLVCVTNKYTVCTMSTCPAGTECPASTCTESSESRCAPPYVAPCQVDADCGDGFTCEVSQACACSGGGAIPVPPSGVGGGTSGGGTGTAGAATVGSGGATGSAGAPAVDCSCTPTGEHHCQPKTYECTTSQDCPSGWTCDANPVAVACGAPTGSAGSANTDCGSATGIANSVCTPPYWGGTLSVGYAQGSAELGSQPAAAYSPKSSAAGQSKDSGGCQVSPGGERSGIGTLFGLGALALVFMRRRSSVRA